MSKSANGLLPAPAAIMKKPPTHFTNSPQGNPSAKNLTVKLKLILRRLPPGLTQTEFEDALGDEWRLGKGRLEWLAYKEGKISKDPSKPSRPSRAYLKLKDSNCVTILSERVKQVSFQDAKNSMKDSCLLGPPSLEFAPFGRVPGSRVRKDGRQGTIDQDQEFIDFLHRLTEPMTRSNINGDAIEGTDAKEEKVTTTPLIQYIKEKKANKAKEAAAAKAAKTQARQESKEAKAEKAKSEQDSKKVTVAKKEAANAAMAEKQARIEKARQEAVKAAQKQAATLASKSTSQTAPAVKKSPSPSPAPSPAKRERERGNASAAARILQRDLGLSPSARGDKKGSRGIKSAHPSDGPKIPPEAEAQQTPIPSAPTVASTTSSKTSSVNDSASANATSTAPQPPSGPRNATPRANNLAATKASQNVRPPPQPRKPPANPQPSPGAKSAFLKHANPSQGITEPLLLEAFKSFGEVTKCEIDKKKGFGYVDFAEAEGLQEAMKNSPIKVGNGHVVVLERKDKPNQRPSAGKPAPAIAAPTPTAPASASPPTPTPPPPTAPAAAPPTAPKSSAPPSGPGRPPPQLRGGMPPRGGFGPGGRGRGGFRGGRAGFQGPPRGGANAAAAKPVAATAPAQTNASATSAGEKE